MKNLFKKIITLLFAMALFTGAVACGNSNNSQNPENPNNPDNPNPPAIETEGSERAQSWTNFTEVDYTNFDKVVTQSDFAIDESVPFNVSVFTPMGAISDHMVLQRNAINKLWGTTSYNGKFAVKIGDTVCYSEASGGKFEIYLPAMKSGGPYDLYFYTATAKKRIRDVLIGDVILFSGQSNMDWMVEDTARVGKQYVYLPSSGGTYIPNAVSDEETYKQYTGTEEIRQQYRDIVPEIKANNDNIRLCNPRYGYSTELIGKSKEPMSDLICSWRAASAEDNSIDSSSMFAYLFAKRLQEAAGIPIGVMMCAVGGTEVPAWCPEEVVKDPDKTDDFMYGKVDVGNMTNPANATAKCYNTFIAPLAGFKFRSVVWYQGEGQSSRYAKSMNHLITAWRDVMGDPELDFLIVELPRYGVRDSFQTGMSQASVQASADPYVGLIENMYWDCRIQQQQIIKDVEYTALSVSINTGDYDDIHPSDKRTIALQACDRFIEVFYGSKELLSGPVFDTIEREGAGGVKLTFKNVGEGLDLRNNGVNFLVSENGADWVEVRATKADASSVLLDCAGTSLSEINHVCYGRLNYPRVSRLDMSKYVSLFNSAGYPCDQFEVSIIAE